MFYLLEALKEIKDTYFSGCDEDGYEPSCGLQNISDGTMLTIGHIFAASIANGGQGPSFLSPWLYKYIVGGEFELPLQLESGKFHLLYKQVIK